MAIEDPRYRPQILDTVVVVLAFVLLIVLSPVLVVALIPFFLLIRKREQELKQIDIPGAPKKGALLGSIGTDYEEYVEFYKQLPSNPKGFLYKRRVMWVNQVSCSNVDAVKQITKYPKSSLHEQISRVFGEGLVFINGDLWKAHRRLLNKPFSPKYLESYLESINLQSMSLESTLDELIGDQPGASAEMDIGHKWSAVTLDVICHTGFGYDLGTARGDNLFVSKMFKERTSSLMNPMMFVPVVGNLFIKMIYYRSIRVTDTLVKTAIETRQQKYADAGGAPNFGAPDCDKVPDMLDLILTSVDKDTGAFLSNKEILDEVFIMMFAGHETTATTMTWVCAELAAHPDVMKRLVEEVDTVLKGESISKMEQTQGLVYTTAVIQETLRKYPVAPFSGRKVPAGVTDIIGVAIPPGTEAAMDMMAAHFNPHVYPEPELWKPERFLEEGGKKLRVYNPAQFMPFNYGPRNCIGKGFAMEEMLVLLTRFVQRYTIAYPEGATSPVASMQTGLVEPKTRVRLVLKKRSLKKTN